MLFLQIAEGDETAFGKVVHLYFPRLLPFVISITKTKPVAEEIVQEVFLKLWQQHADFTHAGNLGSWLFTVAANLSFNFLKKTAREGRFLSILKEGQAGFANPTDEFMDSREKEELIYKAVKQLPPQRQLVYKLSRQQGLNHRQIAEQLNISPHTVKNHLVKALNSLRQFLKSASGLFF